MSQSKARLQTDSLSQLFFFFLFPFPVPSPWPLQFCPRFSPTHLPASSPELLFTASSQGKVTHSSLLLLLGPVFLSCWKSQLSLVPGLGFFIPPASQRCRISGFSDPYMSNIYFIVMEWFGFRGDLNLILFHALPWDSFHYPRLLQAPSNLALNSSRGIHSFSGYPVKDSEHTIVLGQEQLDPFAFQLLD